MKKILQAAALFLLTTLVVTAAAPSHLRVHDGCLREWNRIIQNTEETTGINPVAVSRLDEVLVFHFIN